MLLKEAAPALGLLASQGESPIALFASPSVSFPIKNIEGRNGKRNEFVVCAANHTNGKPLTGVIFEPFEEVKKELMLVPSVSQASLARHKYFDELKLSLSGRFPASRRSPVPPRRRRLRWPENSTLSDFDEILPQDPFRREESKYAIGLPKRGVEMQ